MNKKILLYGIPIVLVMALVGALTYYALFTVTLNIHQPISVTGVLTQPVNCTSGHTCLGEAITVSNDGDEARIISITNNNLNDNVTISYVGELTLSQKDLTSWVSNGNTKIMTYTVVGDTFEAIGVPDNYTLVYYKDNENYVYTGAVVTVITENLPVNDDENAINDNIKDYCQNGFNPNATQCVGAKLWLVPTGAVTGNVIDWSQASSFYFETFLIQFNKEGNIVISPKSSVTFKPQFEVNNWAGDWIGTITTTVA